jgi:hypothetical protein
MTNKDTLFFEKTMLFGRELRCRGFLIIFAVYNQFLDDGDFPIFAAFGACGSGFGALFYSQCGLFRAPVPG